MSFNKVFQEFWEQRNRLKTIYVASCGAKGVPNCAPKMLVDVIRPNKILFLDYKFTQTYGNVAGNDQLSLAFMNDKIFRGYRLTGTCRILSSGPDFKKAKAAWSKRVISYEADRILERVRGGFSTRRAENELPDNFVIVKFTARQAAVIFPDRVLRTLREADTRKRRK